MSLTSARTWGNETTVDAERSAARVTESGGIGVSLRFSLFHAPDSAHTRTYLAAARKGLLGLTGNLDAIISLIAVDDAARAVVAALQAPAGVYNVSEAHPQTRQAHADALAAAARLQRRIHAVPAVATKVVGGLALPVSAGPNIASRRPHSATQPSGSRAAPPSMTGLRPHDFTASSPASGSPIFCPLAVVMCGPVRPRSFYDSFPGLGRT
ncbi:MAG: hypothetical protein R2706_21100 [Acidimicrobiales bacterium]